MSQVSLQVLALSRALLLTTVLPGWSITDSRGLIMARGHSTRRLQAFRYGRAHRDTCRSADTRVNAHLRDTGGHARTLKRNGHMLTDRHERDVRTPTRAQGPLHMRGYSHTRAHGDIETMSNVILLT